MMEDGRGDSYGNRGLGDGFGIDLLVVFLLERLVYWV